MAETRDEAVRYGLVHQTVVAWVSMLGSDFLIHGGILRSLYENPHPFLLSPERAFQLIPLGYLSFLILAALLVWLASRLEIGGIGAGAKFGLVLGGAIWSSTVLGLASITSAPIPLLIGWLVGQTVEMGIAGAVVGAARSGARRRKLWGWVVAWVVIAFVIAVVLQSASTTR